MALLLRILFLLLSLHAGGALAGGAPPWLLRSADGAAQVQVYFFWSASCPHCLAARPQLEALAASRPWIALHEYELTGSADTVARYVEMAQALGEEARSVPAVFYCGRMEVGWGAPPEAHAAALLQRLEACRAAQGAAVAAVPGPGSAQIELPGFGKVDPTQLSLPVLTVLIAAVDAFNPCAFFVLLFLLSLLLHQRRRLLLIGLVFVGCSGLMYYAFMNAWLGLFLLVGGLPWITLLAGAVAVLIGALNLKDFVAFHQGPSLSISEAGRAGIFKRARAILNADSLAAMLGATVFLALAANAYELLCTAGLPMLFTRILSLKVAGAWQQQAYLVLYNLVYVLPLLAIVLAFVRTLGARKLSAREGRLLKLLSGLMMLGLGLALLFVPERLDDPRFAFGLVGLALGLTWVAAQRLR